METWSCCPHPEVLKEKQYNNFSAAFVEFNEDYLRLLKQKTKKPAFSKIDKDFYYLRFNVGANHYMIVMGDIARVDKEFKYQVTISKTTKTGYDRFFRFMEEKWKKVQQ